MKKLLLVSLVAGLASVAAQAESNYNTSGTGGASAKLDFKIVIPRVLFLQVGTGSPVTALANLTTVNEVVFDMSLAANLPTIGNGTAVAGTGGDLGSGRVTVRVMGNSGDVQLVSNNAGGPMTNGGTGPGLRTIGWDKITVATAPLATATGGDWTNGGITHPAFNTTAGGGNSVTAVTLSSTNNVVKREAMWTFAYANDTTPAAGTYGTATNEGQVTYTASAP